jgi:hypothetical protein
LIWFSFFLLVVNCWPSPSNDGTCEVSIEYELENENVALYDLVIAIPLPYVGSLVHLHVCHLNLPSYSDGSYPTVTAHSGEWSLDPSSHSLAWSIPVVSAADDSKTGSLMFNVGGVDVGAFFPVEVSFIGQGSLAGVAVASVDRINGGEAPEYSVDAFVTADEYVVV